MSGITDEAARETHDLIHEAEVQEEREHPNEGQNTQNTQSGDTSKDNNANTTSTGNEGQQSTMDKVKDALHMK